MSSLVNKFQNNIKSFLPDEICIYILQFLEYSDSIPIFRFSNKYYYDENGITNIVTKDEYYLHSKILIKKYPIYRLVSKYYYYIDFNSSCKYCKGRYVSCNRNLRCSNCGHINNFRYTLNNWSSCYKKREKERDCIKDINADYKLMLTNNYK